MDLPYYRQGSFGEDDVYPSSFFTYWKLDNPFGDYGDNKEHSLITRYAVYFYTNDPSVLESTLDDFVIRAKEQGFIISGKGVDVPSDDKAFIGQKINITFKQMNI